MADQLDLAIQIRAEAESALRELRELRGEMRQTGDGGQRAGDQFDRTGRQVETAGRSMRGARGDAQQLGAAARRLTGILVGLAGAAGLGALIRSQLQSADQAIKTARAWGDSAETVSTLGFAAEQAGADLGALESAQESFVRRLPQIRSGSGAASDAVRALGLQVFDAEGNVRQFSEILLDASDSLSLIEDANTRAEVAQQIFGRGSSQLSEVLRLNRSEIEQLQEAGRRYGREISTDTAVQAEIFNDTMNELRGSMSGAARSMMSEMLPSLLAISTQMRDSAADADGLANQIGRAANESIRLLALGIRGAIVPLEAMGEAIGGGIAYVEQLARGNREGAAAIREHMEATGAFEGPLKSLVEFYDALYNAQEQNTGATEEGAEADDRASEAARRRAELMERIRSIMGGAADEERDRADAVQQFIGNLQEEADTWGMSAEAITRYRLELMGATEAQIEHALALQAQVADLEAIAEAERAVEQARQEGERERERMQRQGGRVFEETRTELERYSAQVQRLQELLREGAIDQQTFDRAIEQAAETYERASRASEEMSQFSIQAARSSHQAMSDLFFAPLQGDLDDLVASTARAFARMAADALATAAMMRVAGFFGLPTGAIPGAPTMHTGGLAGDEFLYTLQKGEYVVNRESTRQHRALLEQINRNPRGAIQLPPRMHDGGIAGQMSAGDTHVDARPSVVNLLDPGLFEQYITSSRGERAVINLIGRNRRATLEALS